MKIIISVFLSASVLFSSLGQTILFLHYLTNKNYYETVCENKTKPKMHCNGHCKLAKELKEQSKNEKTPQNNTKEKTEIVLFFETTTALALFTAYKTKSLIAVYHPFVLPGFRTGIFHPPLI